MRFFEDMLQAFKAILTRVDKNSKHSCLLYLEGVSTTSEKQNLSPEAKLGKGGVHTTAYEHYHTPFNHRKQGGIMSSAAVD